jgi:threonine synthase
VVISTANGLKFPEFKIQYHESRLPEVTSRYANLPINLPADYHQIREVILRKLDQRLL